MSDAGFAPVTAADLGDVLALNQAWVPLVGDLDADRLAALVSMTSFTAMERDAHGVVAGFVLALGPGADYASPNYRWFAQRHRRFTYVDRLAVEVGHQRAGLGRRLYAAVADHARSVGSTVMCAEYNLDPPNPRSRSFHAALGFEPVGRQWTYDHGIEVELVELAL